MEENPPKPAGKVNSKETPKLARKAPADVNTLPLPNGNLPANDRGVGSSGSDPNSGSDSDVPTNYPPTSTRVPTYSQADIKELATTRPSLIQTPLLARLTDRARRGAPVPYPVTMLRVMDGACPGYQGHTSGSGGPRRP